MTPSLPTPQQPCLPMSPPLKTSPMHSPQPSPPSLVNPTMPCSRASKTNSKPILLQFPLPWGGGGGAGTNHGYLSLILSPSAYATITKTPFQEPNYPGQHPTIPAGTNAANTSAIICCHTEDLQQWHECKNVITALKNQLLLAIDHIYIHALQDRHVGYMDQPIHAILHHLFKNYGNITPLELENNDTKMRLNWDPNSPFDCLIKQIEDGQDYAEDGGQPYTTEQLLCITYTLVFKTGLYFKECKQWSNCPATEKTGANFTTQFHNAQRLLHDQLHTTKQAGFHSNHANHIPTTKTHPPAEYREALINLTSSAAANRELLTTLANSVATINQHINQLNTPNPNTCNNPIDIDTATDSTALSSLTTSITELQQQICELKKENNNLCNSNNCHPHKYHDNGNYCWTHGYHVGNNHTSATCHNKAPGHQDWATHTNTMGGNQANKLEDL